MLLPPSSGPLAHVDPLRKRPTTFSRSTAPKDTDSSAWTETPTGRAQRVADEVAGIKRKRLPDVGKGRDDEEVQARRERDREIKREVERHNVRWSLTLLTCRKSNEGSHCWTNTPPSQRKRKSLQCGITIATWASLADYCPTQSVRQRYGESNGERADLQGGSWAQRQVWPLETRRIRHVNV